MAGIIYNRNNDKASQISYDNLVSGADSIDTQDVIDEIIQSTPLKGLSEEGVITNIPTTLSKISKKYYFLVSGLSSDIDLNSLPSTYTIGTYTGYELPYGTEFIFFKDDSDYLIKFTQSGEDFQIGKKGDIITILSTSTGYILKSLITRSNSKVFENITALVNNQSNYTLSSIPKDNDLVEVYLAGGHRLHYNSGFTINNNIITLSHNEYRVEIGEVLYIYYYK